MAEDLEDARALWKAMMAHAAPGSMTEPCGETEDLALRAVCIDAGEYDFVAVAAAMRKHFAREARPFDPRHALEGD